MSEIPGIKARHVIITPNCIKFRGEQGAIDEAFRLIKQEYMALLSGWRDVEGVNYHVSLSIERPLQIGKDNDKHE